MSWENESKLTRIAVTVLVSLTFAGVAKLLLANAPSFVDARGLQDLLAKLGGWIFEATSIIKTGENQKLQLGQYGALAGAALMGMGLGWKSIAPWLHKHALASFNHDLLLRVNTITSDGELQLPWKLGEEGPRLDGWHTLERWFASLIAEKSGIGSKTGRYKVAIIAGRSGSGKTRMAEEMGLHLARRGPYSPGKRRDRAMLATGAWLRRVLPLQPKATDPWDFGRIDHTGSGNNLDEFLKRLSNWWPRRPTVLLLDDPAGNEAGRIHAALSRDDAHCFRFPVVLLIANQTLPQGCPFLFDTASNIWTFDGAPAVPQPVILPVESWFSPKQVRELVAHFGLLSSMSEPMKKEVREDAVHRITGGNPLLVLLSIEWLQAKGTLDGMTVDSLKEDRAARIITALKAAGVGNSDEYAELLVATLAGGGRRDALHSALASSEMHRGASILSRGIAELQRCFPSDSLKASDGTLVLPPIRPEMIVAPFCAAVIEEYRMDLDRVILAACHLNLAHTLRMRRRIPNGGDLGQAMARIDPQTIPDLPQLQWAIAEVEAAMFIEHDELDSWTEALQNERIARADAAIEALRNSKDRERLCKQIAALAASRRVEYDDGRRLLPHLALRFVHEAIVPEDVMIDAEFLIAFYGSLALASEGPFEGLLGRQDGVHRVGRNCQDATAGFALLRAANLLGPLCWPWFRRLPHAISSAHVKSRKSIGTFLAFRSIRHWQTDRFAAIERIVNIQSKISAGGRTEEQEWVNQLTCLTEKLMSCGRNCCQSHRLVAQNLSSDVVELLSRPNLTEEQSLAAIYAFEQIALGWAQEADGAGAEQIQNLASLAVDMARNYPKNWQIQCYAATLLWHNIWAFGQKPNASGLDQLCQISNVLNEFSMQHIEDSSIQSLCVMSKRMEAELWAWHHLGETADQAKVAADEATLIASRFEEDANIQLERAKARRFEAFAWCHKRDGAGALQAGIAADLVATIANRFPELPDIQLEGMLARRYEVYAAANFPNGAKAEQAHSATAAAIFVSKRFPDCKRIQGELVAICCWETQAWAAVPLGAKAMQARESAKQAAVIAEQFPAEYELQLHAARAYSYEAFAWCKRPYGEHAEGARAAAHSAAVIADRFPVEDKIHLHPATARRYEAFAWARHALGSGAENAAKAADATIRIAAYFPDDVAFQSEAAEARRNEAHAWSQRPNGSGAIQARRAADAAAGIAARFTENDKIQNEAYLATACAEEAEAASKAAGNSSHTA